jgi:hypothetical protein
MNRRTLSAALLPPLLALASPAWAQLPNDELQCRPDEPRLDKYGYLRALSLDLLGRPPTVAEYAALDAHDDVPEATLDAMLASDEFVGRAVRFHRALLWNNVRNVDLLNFQTGFQVKTPENLYWRRNPSVRYRGTTTAANEQVPCLNVPATFDANGRPVFVDQGDGTRREGYVEVQPYWAPTTTIKVCAADAQTFATSLNGTACDTNDGLNDAGCGCGPNLRLCRYSNYQSVTEAFSGDIDRRIAKLIREDRPYLELFTSRTAFVNGPMVHFLKYQTGVPAGARVTPLPYQNGRLPELNFTEVDNWQEVELDASHAGVLTSLAYLLRFQTNRARASHFYDFFLCQPFTPPAGGLPTVDPTVLPHPDLQKRDGCKYCHALLEPAAAHWGRWTERGAGFLDPNAYPATREDCRQCGMTGQLCSRECRLYYITNTFSSAEDLYIGSLNAYAYLKPQAKMHVEHGPKLLVANTVVDDRFPSCTARRALEGFFGRELTNEERGWAEDLGHEFVAGEFSYRALIKSIAQSSIYRRVR